ncbi:MAG: hypothetical protein V2A55_02170 [Candidatus Jorgensenbacteria bacterium]
MSSSNKKGDKKNLLSNWGAFVLIGIAVAITLVANLLGKNDWFREKSVAATAPRSCEVWAEQYAVIPWDQFPGDTLRVGRGEEWVVQLHPTEPSGWVVLDPRASDNWTRPTGTVHMLFSDGLEVLDAPGKMVERGRRNTFRAWGEGCLLIQVSS